MVVETTVHECDPALPVALEGNHALPMIVKTAALEGDHALPVVVETDALY